MGGNNMTIQSQLERTAPLTQEQVQQYEKEGYIIIPHGCSDDLIDMFNNTQHREVPGFIS
jgi:hypothetical protein